MKKEKIRFCPNCGGKMNSSKAVNWQLYTCPICDIEISESIFLEIPKIVKWKGKQIQEEKNEKNNS